VLILASGLLIAATGLARDLQEPNALRVVATWDSAWPVSGSTLHGLGVQAGYHGHVAEDWTLWVNGSYAGFPETGRRADLAGLSVGATYLLDTGSWVPEVHAGVGVFGSPATGAWPVDAGIVAGASLEWRGLPGIGLGIRAEWRYLIRNRADWQSFLSVGPQVTFRFPGHKGLPAGQTR
jgi:hypothetical protein